MTTDKGNRLLAACYSDWIRTVRYGTTPSVTLLDQCLWTIWSPKTGPASGGSAAVSVSL